VQSGIQVIYSYTNIFYSPTRHDRQEAWHGKLLSEMFL